MSAVKLILMVKRRPDLSAEAFRELYENWPTHAGLRLMGHLWTSYRRHYVEGGQMFIAAKSVPVGGNYADDPVPYDCISEIVYPDMAALEEAARIAAIPENKAMIEEEEEALFDRSKCWTLMCKVADFDPPVDAVRFGNVHIPHAPG